MKNILATFIVLVIMIIGCNTSNKEVIAATHAATLEDYRGLDGCVWVVQLTDGTVLEPVNLDEFDIVPVDGKPIELSYTEVASGSICMVGPTIEIQVIIAR